MISIGKVTMNPQAIAALRAAVAEVSTGAAVAEAGGAASFFSYGAKGLGTLVTRFGLPLALIGGFLYERHQGKMQKEALQTFDQGIQKSIEILFPGKTATELSEEELRILEREVLAANQLPFWVEADLQMKFITWKIEYVSKVKMGDKVVFDNPPVIIDPIYAPGEDPLNPHQLASIELAPIELAEGLLQASNGEPEASDGKKAKKAADDVGDIDSKKNYEFNKLFSPIGNILAGLHQIIARRAEDAPRPINKAVDTNQKLQLLNDLLNRVEAAASKSQTASDAENKEALELMYFGVKTLVDFSIKFYQIIKPDTESKTSAALASQAKEILELYGLMADFIGTSNERYIFCKSMHGEGIIEMKLKTPLAYDSSDTLALLLGSTEAEMIRLYHSLLEEITNNPSEISMNVLEALDQLFPPGDQPEFLAKTGAALGTALDHVTDRALRRKLNSLVYRLDGLKRKGQKPSPKQKRKIIKVFNSNQTEEFRKAYEAYLDWIGAPPEDYNKLKNQNDFIVFLTDADIVFRKSGKIAETSKASVATLRNQTTDPRTTTQLPPGLRLEMREELEILELLFPENTNEN